MGFASCNGEGEPRRPDSLSLFFDDDDDTLAPMEAEPPTYPVQIILDSGASEHVASREDFPGYGVGESPGSKTGKHYTGASGHRIRNEGEAKVQMIAPAGDGKQSELSTVFQVAKVTRPLMSVSKICKDGRYDVLCRQDKAFVLARDTQKVIAEFERQNGLYVTTVQVKNPKSSGFHRQE